MKLSGRKARIHKDFSRMDCIQEDKIELVLTKSSALGIFSLNRKPVLNQLSSSNRRTCEHFSSLQASCEM